MKIEYRRAKLTDIKGIAHVHVKTWQHIYQDEIPANILKKIDVEKRMQEWKGWLSARKSVTYLALVNNIIVGFISWGKSRDIEASKQEAEIYAIYIDPDFWGQGIGRDLMSLALSDIEHENYQSVSLWVLKSNKRAQKFYNKQKFIKKHREKKKGCVEGLSLAEIQYKKYFLTEIDAVQSRDYLLTAIQLAENNVKQGGRPFASVIVKNKKVIATGLNSCVQTKDPTAHAEIMAIREASKLLKSESLKGCELYTTSEPCPMCLGALYWAELEKIVFALPGQRVAQYYIDKAEERFRLHTNRDQLPLTLVAIDNEQAILKLDLSILKRLPHPAHYLDDPSQLVG
jgi:tRNA(Arg) A34 adenosine deaminase TadA/ribosomal protein S18 acetylase RimI-like enzyme